MNAKEEFIQIYKENIHREGADAFLEFLEGDNVKIKFTKMDRLFFTNLDRII